MPKRFPEDHLYNTVGVCGKETNRNKTVRSFRLRVLLSAVAGPDHSLDRYRNRMAPDRKINEAFAALLHTRNVLLCLRVRSMTERNKTKNRSS